MPRTYLMSWEGSPNYRWRKLYKGVPYRVTCQELGAMVYTAEATYKLANEWWTKTLAELLGDRERANKLDSYRQAYIERKQDQARQLLETVESFGPVAKQLADGVDSAHIPEIDTLDLARPIPARKTLKYHVDNWLLVVQGNNSPSSYREIRDYIKTLLAAWGEGMDVARINEETVRERFLLMKKSSLSDGRKKKHWGFFKRFLDYLVENKIIPALSNLHSKLFSFRVETKEVKAWDMNHVRSVLASLTPRQRCYALLGLNCGMTNADIGQLKRTMIVNGILTRKRIKTKKEKGVPTVSYTLWPETQALLQQCTSKHPELVLTGQSGEPLWTSYFNEKGEPKKKDMIVQQWRRAKIKIPLKAFRSIAATVIESHPVYGRFTQLFLGHAPGSLDKKHYAREADILFQEALTWLRTQVIGQGLPTITQARTQEEE